MTIMLLNLQGSVGGYKVDGKNQELASPSSLPTDGLRYPERFGSVELFSLAFPCRATVQRPDFEFLNSDQIHSPLHRFSRVQYGLHFARVTCPLS